MSPPAVLAFEPVLPREATGLDLIDRLQLPDSLFSENHLIRSPVVADYLSRRALRIGAPPRTSNASFLDSPLAHLETDFPAMLRTWISTSPLDDAHSFDSSNGLTANDPPCNATRASQAPPHRFNATRASQAPPQFLQEGSRFHKLGSIPIGGFLCLASVGSSDPFGVLVNIPSVGTNAEVVACEDLGFDEGEEFHADLRQRSSAPQ
jgi:hypothetical protein